MDLARLLENERLLKEYAQLIEHPAYWLLPDELAIVAHTFNITIHYYIRNPIAGRNIKINTYHPGCAASVSIFFNGVNHYERMTSKVEFEQLLKASLFNATKDKGKNIDKTKRLTQNALVGLKERYLVDSLTETVNKVSYAKALHLNNAVLKFIITETTLTIERREGQFRQVLCKKAISFSKERPTLTLEGFTEFSLTLDKAWTFNLELTERNYGIQIFSTVPLILPHFLEIEDEIRIRAPRIWVKQGIKAQHLILFGTCVNRGKLVAKDIYLERLPGTAREETLDNTTGSIETLEHGKLVIIHGGVNNQAGNIRVHQCDIKSNAWNNRDGKLETVAELVLTTIGEVQNQRGLILSRTHDVRVKSQWGTVTCTSGGALAAFQGKLELHSNKLKVDETSLVRGAKGTQFLVGKHLRLESIFSARDIVITGGMLDLAGLYSTTGDINIKQLVSPDLFLKKKVVSGKDLKIDGKKIFNQGNLIAMRHIELGVKEAEIKKGLPYSCKQIQNTGYIAAKTGYLKLQAETIRHFVERCKRILILPQDSSLPASIEQDTVIFRKEPAKKSDERSRALYCYWQQQAKIVAVKLGETWVIEFEDLVGPASSDIVLEVTAENNLTLFEKLKTLVPQAELRAALNINVEGDNLQLCAPIKSNQDIWIRPTHYSVPYQRSYGIGIQASGTLRIDLESEHEISHPFRNKAGSLAFNLVKKGRIVLANTYRVPGDFILQELDVKLDTMKQLMEQRFGEGKGELAKPEFYLEIQGIIQADKGLKVLAPSTKLQLGNEQTTAHPELIMPQAKLEVYVNELDIVKGGIAAKEGFIWAPNGLTLGRLIEDPTRQVFATMYSHSQRPSSSCSLGALSGISYQFLGQNRSGSCFYHGHLFVLPVAVINGSFIDIEDALEIIAPFRHWGDISTGQLKITSARPSVFEASKTVVRGDAILHGHFNLKRVCSTFKAGYQKGYTYSADLVHNFCNSDTASLEIVKELSGDAVIVNEGSILNVFKQSPSIRINSLNINTTYQKIISGTRQELVAIRDSHYSGLMRRHLRQGYYTRGNEGVVACSGYPFGISKPSNYILDYYHNLPYAVGFLVKTQNFVGAQCVYQPQLATNSPALLSTSKLEGRVSAPYIFLPLGNQLVAVGSASRYRLPFESPIQNLSTIKLNAYTTIRENDLKEMLEASLDSNSGIKFYFELRERFRFDDAKAQAFFRDIYNDMVVVTGTGALKKPELKTILPVSPSFLIESVREATQKVLLRGYIYENRPMDEALVKELHHNATEYLRQHNLIEGGFKEALQGNNRIPLPTKPLIYYLPQMNKQGLEVIHPQLYFPLTMVNEVRSRLGDVVKTKLLMAFPKQFRLNQLVTMTENCPELQQALVDCVMQTPELGQRLMLESTPSATEDLGGNLIENDVVDTPGITISGHCLADKIGIVSLGKILVTGNIEAARADILLVSLFDNVEIKSSLERIYSGSMENYIDILHSARVAANGILCILSGKDVIFEAAETHSKLKTHIEALGNILDMPVELVYQHIQTFYSKKCSGIIMDTAITQATSSHQVLEGDFKAAAGGSSAWYGPRFQAREGGEIVSRGTVALHSVTNSSIRQSEIKETKSRWYGGHKETITQEITESSNSIGPQFHGKVFTIKGEEGVIVSQLDTSAEANRFHSFGEVYIKQGQNQSLRTYQRNSKDLFWQKRQAEVTKYLSYSPCLIPGSLEVQARRIILDCVNGKALEFIERLENRGNSNLEYRWLVEQYQHDAQRVQGPTAALAALTALAVTIATAGTGTAIATELGFATATATGGTALTLGGTMIAAGFSGLCSQAAVALLSNEGNPLEAIKSLGSGEALRSLATTVLTAGVMHEICQALKLPTGLGTKTPLQHLHYHLARASVTTVLNITLNKHSPAQALRVGLAEAAVGTVAGIALQGVGLAHSSGQMDTVAHKILHTAMGGMSGALLEGSRGILSGAIGGLVASTMAELLEPENEFETNLRAIEQEKGGPLTAEELAVFTRAECMAYEARLTRVADYSRLLAASAAFMAHQEVAGAIYAGTQTVVEGDRAGRMAAYKTTEASRRHLQNRILDREAERKASGRAAGISKPQNKAKPNLMSTAAPARLGKTWERIEPNYQGGGLNREFYDLPPLEETQILVDSPLYTVSASKDAGTEHAWVAEALSYPVGAGKPYADELPEPVPIYKVASRDEVGTHFSHANPSPKTEASCGPMMAFRALKGERSSEVLAWQQQNRKQMPRLAQGLDALDRAQQELRMGTRFLGLLQALGGGTEIVVASSIGPFGLPLATMGADNVSAGFLTFWRGEHQPTLLFQGINALGEKTGLYGPQAAAYIEGGLNMMVPAINPKALTFAYRSGAARLRPPIQGEIFPEVELVSQSLGGSNHSVSDPLIFSRQPANLSNKLLQEALIPAITQKGLNRIESHLDQILLHQNIVSSPNLRVTNKNKAVVPF